MAGIGLDAQVMKHASRKLKDTIGMFAYVISVVKNIPKRRGKYQITIDGKKTVVYKAKSVMGANMGKIQGGIAVVPKANPQDGVLRIGVLRAKDISTWISVCFHALLGRVDKSPYYTLLTGSHIWIESLRGPQVYQCDGNEFPAG